MYKIEALCEQDKIEAAYEVVHKWMRTKLNKNANIDARFISLINNKIDELFQEYHIIN